MPHLATLVKSVIALSKSSIWVEQADFGSEVEVDGLAGVGERENLMKTIC